MILKNPTDKDVSITFKGIARTIPAGEKMQVDSDLAAFWIRTHEFLIADMDVVEPFVPTTFPTDEPAEEAPEVKEEEAAPEPEEAPAPKPSFFKSRKTAKK